MHSAACLMPLAVLLTPADGAEVSKAQAVFNGSDLWQHELQDDISLQFLKVPRPQARPTELGELRRLLLESVWQHGIFKDPVHSFHSLENMLHPSSQIPRRIVQTLNVKENLPPSMASAVLAWQTLNPRYEHELHDTSDMRRFIAEHFHQTFLRIFDSLGQYQQRSDLWRLCYLYIRGGVYVDAGYAPLAPLSAFIPTSGRLRVSFVAGVSSPVLLEPSQPPPGCHTRPEALKRLQNGFLAVSPGHPVILLALQKARWNYFKRQDQHYLLALGPALLYEAYAALFGDPLGDVLVGPRELGAMLGIDIAHFLGRSHRRDVLLLLDMGRAVFSAGKDHAVPRLLHKYKGWLQEIESIRDDNATHVAHGGTCLRRFR
eukprot:TRINITY_DN48344_c0_g1_i1.p1 TRINITY_DN48344_c0_g1~~TRINITY_DN48344_c0_g1_i1.p1  ORF type:complete len:374 (-),score=58.21 TRINITY_DN48344_c0_g1_i1:24-1145(-)